MSARPEISVDIIENARRTSLAGAKTFYLPAPEPGLWLRFQKGKVTWVVRRRRANGARVPLRIGLWPSLSIEAACEVARVSKLRFAEHHGKPLKQRSIKELLARYDMEKLSQQRSAAPTKRSLVLLFRNYTEREIRSITRDDLEAALGAIATTSQIHANRCLAYAHAFFNWAIDRRFLGTNPATGLVRFMDEPRRSRILSIEELGEIWIVAQGLGYPFGRAIELLVLVPFKREVVAALQREDLTHDGRSWEWRRPGLVSRGEPGEDVYWRLPYSVNRTLREAWMQAPAESSFVFTGNGFTPVSGWSRAKAALDRSITARRHDCNLPPLTRWHLNDIRNSFAHIARERLSESDELIARCLDRGQHFQSPMMREWGRSQDIVDSCTQLLEVWGEVVFMAADHLKSERSSEASEQPD